MAYYYCIVTHSRRSYHWLFRRFCLHRCWDVEAMHWKKATTTLDRTCTPSQSFLPARPPLPSILPNFLVRINLFCIMSPSFSFTPSSYLPYPSFLLPVHIPPPSPFSSSSSYLSVFISLFLSLFHSFLLFPLPPSIFLSFLLPSSFLPSFTPSLTYSFLSITTSSSLPPSSLPLPHP